MRSGIVMWTARAAVLAGVLATTIAASPASAKSDQEVRLRDDCEPVSFNAVLGPGACIGNGGTTIDEFNSELAQRGSVGAWKYNPDHTQLSSGQHLVLVNRGGETHTFTRVAAFGGGFVAPLNQASGNLVPAAECATVLPDGSLVPKPVSASNIFVPAQQQVAGPAFGPGTTLYQCCIHPWMRVVVAPH